MYIMICIDFDLMKELINTILREKCERIPQNCVLLGKSPKKNFPEKVYLQK